MHVYVHFQLRKAPAPTHIFVCVVRLSGPCDQHTSQLILNIIRKHAADQKHILKTSAVYK